MPAPAAHHYLIALGGNRWHPQFGPPRATLAAALAALDDGGRTVLAAAPVMTSRPLGPSLRTYANAAALVASTLPPGALLDQLQALEHRFGRRRRGQPWSARVIDLDIVLWSGGSWHGPGLTIPHPRFRDRAFVLAPARVIAGRWRDPLTGLTLRHLHARLTRPRPLPKPRHR